MDFITAFIIQSQPGYTTPVDIPEPKDFNPDPSLTNRRKIQREASRRHYLRKKGLLPPFRKLTEEEKRTGVSCKQKIGELRPLPKPKKPTSEERKAKIKKQKHEYYLNNKAACAARTKISNDRRVAERRARREAKNG